MNFGYVNFCLKNISASRLVDFALKWRQFTKRLNNILDGSANGINTGTFQHII